MPTFAMMTAHLAVWAASLKRLTYSGFRFLSSFGFGAVRGSLVMDRFGASPALPVTFAQGRQLFVKRLPTTVD
jgi:hypothetical protein